MARCRTPRESTVIIWPEKRDNYADDVKTLYHCRTCGGEGYAHFDQSTLNDLDPPLSFQCEECSHKEARELRAKGLCPSCGEKPCTHTCELQETPATRRTPDGRIIVDNIDQLENEDYHDNRLWPNHIMERTLSTTMPQWMDVTCACGMRITISPEVEAELEQNSKNWNRDSGHR